MISVVLDTNAWLYLLGKDNPNKSLIANLTIDDNPIFSTETAIIVPFAVQAELLSIGIQRNWGKSSFENLAKLVSGKMLIHSNSQILDIYVAIDTYSLGKHPNKPMPERQSSRIMGKNDLWIAAIAFHLDAYLITNDRDFDHLTNFGLKVIGF